MLLKPFSKWVLDFPTLSRLSSEPSSKKARLTLTTDELVVSDDDEIDDTEDFDDSDYLDEGEYEAEEADQWWLHWTYGERFCIWLWKPNKVFGHFHK